MDLVEVLCNLGYVLRLKNELDDAIAVCRKAIELRPDLPSAYDNLGSTLQTKGEMEEAIAAHRKAIELAPDFADAYSNLGVALHSVDRLDQGTESFRKAAGAEAGFGGGAIQPCPQPVAAREIRGGMAARMAVGSPRFPEPDPKIPAATMGWLGLQGSHPLHSCRAGIR